MNYWKYLKFVNALSLAVAITVPAFAQDKKDAPGAGGQASQEEMMKMMLALAQPGPSHQILSNTVGNWTYAGMMWMDPDPKAAPTELKGTAKTKSIFGGRYFTSEHAGIMPMPGPDGKVKDTEFTGLATEAYDNVKKKYLSTWIDNMETSILYMEGTYDAATKTLTYTGEYMPMPGATVKIRQVIKYADKDHRLLEWFEDRGGTEVRTMSLLYTRTK